MAMGPSRNDDNAFTAKLCAAVSSITVSDSESRVLIGRSIADTLVVAAAGFAEPILGELIAAYPGGGVQLWSGKSVESAEAAIFINGVASHVLDFDDVYLDSTAHPSAVILPAILAVGEPPRSQCLIDAFAAGLVTARAIARRLGHGHYHKGWHGTGTIGAFAAAAAAARILGLDQHRLRSAFALAAAQSAGLRANFGTLAKPCHAGFAAAAGFRAVRLAAAGIDGAQDVFGGGGYADLYGEGDGDIAPDAGFFALNAEDLAVKLYPCCYAAHRLIRLALDVRADVGISAADPLATYELRVLRGSIDVLRYRRATTPAEAKFCGPHILAVTLLDGAPGLAHFEPSALVRADVRAIMERISIVEIDIPGFGRDIRDGTATLVATIGAAQRTYARAAIPGGKDDPPTVRDIKDKATMCLARFESAFGSPFPALKIVRGIPEVDSWLPQSVL